MSPTKASRPRLALPGEPGGPPLLQARTDHSASVNLMYIQTDVMMALEIVDQTPKGAPHFFFFVSNHHPVGCVFSIVVEKDYTQIIVNLVDSKTKKSHRVVVLPVRLPTSTRAQ